MKESIIQQKRFAFALQTVRLYQRLCARHEYVLSK